MTFFNKEYQSPRRVLKAFPGLEMVEMNRSRVREAAETGAAILAVACPNCAKMLEDAVKAENLEEMIAVKDIAEIIQGGQI